MTIDKYFVEVHESGDYAELVKHEEGDCVLVEDIHDRLVDILCSAELMGHAIAVLIEELQ